MSRGVRGSMLDDLLLSLFELIQGFDCSGDLAGCIPFGRAYGSTYVRECVDCFGDD